jgi:hypothetical protein
VQSDGEIGGDYQVGESWSVRFVLRNGDYVVAGDHPRLPLGSGGATVRPVVTEWWYAEQTNLMGRHTVTCQREFMLCTDPTEPGDTEVWSDALYEVGTRIYCDPVVAERQAEKAARRSQASAIQWDGCDLEVVQKLAAAQAR